VDGDARGGAAISMRAVTNVPIKFLATGEKIDGFELFHPDRLATRILGMGDMISLIEKAQDTFDEREAMKLQEKLMKNQFTLQDFLEQLQKIRKMGSFAQLLGMIPGMSRFQDQINQEDMEKRIKKVEAIIHSMTAKERANPKILDASRKKRIARGSGVEVRDINDLIKQFKQMQDMMSQLRQGRMPRIPGMPMR
jgi:signal recognition particle subunit SRP54